MANNLIPIPDQQVIFTKNSFIDDNCLKCGTLKHDITGEISFQMYTSDVYVPQTQIANQLPNNDFTSPLIPTEWIVTDGTQSGTYLTGGASIIGAYKNIDIITANSISVLNGETFYLDLNYIAFDVFSLFFAYGFKVELFNGSTIVQTFNYGLQSTYNTVQNQFTNTSGLPMNITVRIRHSYKVLLDTQIDFIKFGKIQCLPIHPTEPTFKPQSVQISCCDGSLHDITASTIYQYMGSHIFIRPNKAVVQSLCSGEFTIIVTDQLNNVFESAPNLYIDNSLQCNKLLNILFTNSCDFGAKASPRPDNCWYYNSSQGQWNLSSINSLLFEGYVTYSSPDVTRNTSITRSSNGVITNYNERVISSEYREKLEVTIVNLGRYDLELLMRIFEHTYISLGSYGEQVIATSRPSIKQTGRFYEFSINVARVENQLQINNCCC